MFFGKRGAKRIFAACIAVLFTGSVAGCGASSSENGIEIPGITGNGQSQTINVDYEVPQQVPNILVDQVGFKPDSEKELLIRAKELPTEFQIRNLETGEVVYEGKLVKPTFDEKTGEYTAIGYFTELKEEGNYYASADIVGESYAFSISETVYTDLFNDACKKFYYNRCGIALSENLAGENAHSACHTIAAHLQDEPSVEIDVTGGWHMDEQADRDTVVGCKIAENFLLAYELNKEAFTDETGIPESGNGIPDILDEVRYEVEWLLKMQDPKSGGEYGAALTDNTKGGDLFSYPVVVTPVSMDSTISFAATLARFSFFYQEYDPDFARECLRAADKAWNCYVNNQKVLESSGAFNAAAQLYRATGNSSYDQILQAFFEKRDFLELFNTDENIFLGSVTYLSTNQKVDMDLCGKLMKYLMQRSEDIALKATQSKYLVADYDSDNIYASILFNMRCLTITDYIIYNHEYTTIVENHAHYLMGMNPDVTNYVTEYTERTYVDGQKPGILNNPSYDSLFVFMLSILVKE